MTSQQAPGNNTANSTDPKIDPPVTFNKVLEEELKKVQAARQMRNKCSGPQEKVPEAHEDNLIGLAFSGGGIRSATFNLGILQALAQSKLLRKFDYLSTVSGGGYVGSWVAALTKRLTDPPQGAKWEAGSFADVEEALSSSRYECEKRSEPPVVHWLRLYSNYLTPHTGLVSGDTWAMIGTWLRNTILNQTIFALVFVAVLTLCQGAVLALVKTENKQDGVWLLTAAGLVLALATFDMARNVVRQVPPDELLRHPVQRLNVGVTVILPFLVASILLNSALWRNTKFACEPFLYWVGAACAFYFAVWGIVALLAFLGNRSAQSDARERLISNPALVISSIVTGAFGGCLLYGYMWILSKVEQTSWVSQDWLVVVFGSGIVMIILLLAGMLHIGLVGRGSVDLVREWWARLGGYLKLITIGWVLLSATCVFAPLAVRWAIFHSPKVSFTAAAIWVLHNILGLNAAKSAKTSGKPNDPIVKKAVIKAKEEAESTEGGQKSDGIGQRVKEKFTSPAVLGVLATAAPYVFIVGLVLILSTLVHIATGLCFDPAGTQELWHRKTLEWPALNALYWHVVLCSSVLKLLLFGSLLFAAGFLLSWRVDVNDFSLHHFYRNRLVRCYLGASNPERKAEPFTGFDSKDDLPLCNLTDNYPGPYPILNAALNVTSGEELGYATRRAKSFAFTPLYSGYELGAPGKERCRYTRENGYSPSYALTQQGRSKKAIGKLPLECGISLGTAMAISGAAASPNMGYHTNPATAFFMALFDVRLGWWMGNSRYEGGWGSSGPKFGLPYLFSELMAQSDEKKKYVYLSDGGHFENLAVYELIRRRCRLIVACDGDADACYQFSDLQGLIEKARRDFGVRIEIDFASIRPADGGRECPKNFVVGKIYYDPERKDVGTLILLKASLPQRAGTPNPAILKLPDDVWQYSERQKMFPHQTTADQWFDELQFESYRALGEHIGSQAARRLEDAILDALDYPRLDWRPEQSVPATVLSPP